MNTGEKSKKAQRNEIRPMRIRIIFWYFPKPFRLVRISSIQLVDGGLSDV